MSRLPYIHTHTNIKPYANVNTTINNAPDSQTFVKLYTILKTIIKPVLNQPPPKPANPTSKKIDLSKVGRSGRNVWKSNVNKKESGKVEDDPSELQDDDKDAHTSKNQSATRIVGEARHGSFLGLLKKIDTIKYA
jgi:hypothetical protein